MYKKSSKFFQGLSGTGRKGRRRFGTGLAKSADVGRQDRHDFTGNREGKRLGKRLDAEVAKANAAAKQRGY